METSTVTISVDDTDEEIRLPEGVLSYFAEESESLASTVGDLVVVDCTHRLHGAVHHGEGEPGDEVVALEESMRDAFESRFGASFAELTGHQH